MRNHFVITVALASILVTGCANRAGQGQNMAGSSPAQAGQMDETMRAMADAHSKMMSAKSPDERKALMAEHHKAMREGMAAMHASMGPTQPGPHCMNAEAMQKHQEMMQMMMQMMSETPDAPAPVSPPG